MQKEEERLKEETKREREQTKANEEQRLENEEDNKSMTDLDWFLSRSQVGTCALGQCDGLTEIFTGLLICYHGPAQTGSGSQEDPNSIPAEARLRRQNAGLSA